VVDVLFKGLQFGTPQAVRVPLQDFEGTGLDLHLLYSGWVGDLVVELLHGARFICCCFRFDFAPLSVS